MRGFIFDILTFSVLMFILIIAVLLSYVLLNGIFTAADVSGLKPAAADTMMDQYGDLDTWVGFIFAVIAIVLLTYAYLSNSSTPVIIMFILIGILIMSLVINVQAVLSGMFTQLTAYDATVGTRFVYTKFIIDNFSLLVGAVAFCMGAIMHLKGDK